MKQSEIKDLSADALKDQLAQTRKAYADMMMTHSLSPIENPLQIRTLRKTVARLATELTKRNSQ